MPAERPATGLSIFFPAYNDSGTIASLVITALRTARELTPDFEVIAARLRAVAEAGAFTVAFGGGEPLSRPDLGELAVNLVRAARAVEPVQSAKDTKRRGPDSAGNRQRR